MKIPFGKPIIGDEEHQAVREVLASGRLVHGQRIVDFETAFAEFTGAPHAVGVSSCTAGMHLVYFHLGIGPGDEVIVPAMTHTATAHAVELAGARAVFVDAEPETGNIDLDRLEAAVTARTRAIAPVHYLGMPIDMDGLMTVARRHDLHVVEDCALALGSTYRGTHAGLFGDVGCFSFYPVKHITSAEGGMVICRDRELAAALAHKRAFGVDRHHGERKTPGVYEVSELGFNYRMSEVHAAIGREQMRRLPDFLDRRRQNYQALTESLRAVDGIELFASTHGELTSCYYCQSIILDPALADRRPQLIEYLRDRGVGTSVYYPHPVPTMEHYRRKYGHRESEFPVAARIANHSIALPVGPHLTVDDMGSIATAVSDGLREVS